MPNRVGPTPPQVSYAKLLRNCLEKQMPQPKIDARPALVPLVEEANRLLADPEATNEAYLDIYSRLMRVGPARPA